MKRLERHVGLLVLGMLLCAQAPSPSEVEIVVVVNSASPPKQMVRKSASEVFMFKRQFWANREPIVIVLQLNDVALHAAFCAKVLETPCDARDQAELERKYQGNLFARVLRANSSAEAALLLQQNPMAIGYFRRGNAPANAQIVFQP